MFAHSATESPVPVPVPVVGLGASAGGLQPLLDFLHACAPGAGLAYVVVQHMGALQPSSLPHLLSHQQPLAVQVAVDGEWLLADHIYVIQPGTQLSVEAGRLIVQSVAPPAGAPSGIDHLFHSRALALGPNAIGVVLSGMGSDGSKGLAEIASAGGLALVQEASSAQFDAMPQHAASAASAVGAKVIVALPADMPARIAQARAERGQGSNAVAQVTAPASVPAPTADALPAILACVAQTTGHDFSLYQASTLHRRIERRMAIHRLTSAGDYRDLLAKSPAEAALLFSEMLIGVTAWFRDPDVWEAMGQLLLPALCKAAAARHEPHFRAWVVGCSTGEEAYTLAILVRETIDADPSLMGLPVQIFATDLNVDGVAAARSGFYPASIANALTPQRLARFFVAEGGGYRVHKSVRDMILFAQHDVISDAPFSRLDLLCCRNLLIYFRATLQQCLLKLFKYVLPHGGMLVLGSSEALGRAAPLFEPVDAKLRIYRAGSGALRGSTLMFPVRAPNVATLATKELHMTDPQAASTATLRLLVEQLMLDEYAPAAVLVDANGDIVYLSGRTGRFLEPAAGKANWNVHAMARDGLRLALDGAMQEAVSQHHVAEAKSLPLTYGNQQLGVDLVVRPVAPQAGGLSAEMYLLVFRETAPPAAPPARRSRRLATDGELQAARDEVQALRVQMRTSHEALQATNEELQSTNEELQSANEELTTSKEEMQAMNEELQTVNAELTSKLDDLALAQSDLQNLLNSTQIATLFLDGSANVRRFTEQAEKVFSLRHSDIGRPLTDLTTSLEYPLLNEDISEVLRTLKFRERSVPCSDGRWYTVRVMPYRTMDNVIDGSVITFVDITAAKALESQLRSASGDAAE